MARQIGKLTTIRVRNAKARGLYGDGGGLFLQVGVTGGKSWVFRWKRNGKFRVMGLGPVHTISLAEAREKALACRKLRLDGIDPIEHRRGQRQAAMLDAANAMTFRESAEAYIAAHRAGWRNDKHAAQWPATLSAYVYPVFGEFPVQAIDTGLVMKTLEPVWTKRPETAGRIRGRIEAILDWAKARGYREGENPARWRCHLENLLPKRGKVRRVKHHAALPYTEVAAFMTELRELDGVAARALEFAILTAARTGEVIGARWKEINVADRVWIVSAERMKKTDREHRVPLSDRALALIGPEGKPEQFVFPGARAGQPLSNMALLMMLRRMGRGELTSHGFRSTFRDWCAESTAFPAEVAEMALSHTVGDKVEAAYRRGDLFQKRRQLADAWGAYCDSPAQEGEIVPIRHAPGRDS